MKTSKVNVVYQSAISEIFLSKIMLKISVICLVLIVLEATASEIVKFKVHSCPNEREALVCSSQCQRRDDLLSYEFKANASQSLVLVDVFSQGHFTGTFQVKGKCSVVDSKNWICEENLKNFDWISTTKETVRKGVWTRIIKGSKPNGSEVVLTAACGK